MPKFCAVIGCSNTYKSSNVSLHEFPKAPDIRKRWEDFVKVHRSDFSVSGIRSPQTTTTELTALASPTRCKATPVICGNHFLRGDFENILAYELNFDSKRLLRKGAVPSVQPSKETLDKLRAALKSQTVSSTAPSVSGEQQTNIYGKLGFLLSFQSNFVDKSLWPVGTRLT